LKTAFISTLLCLGFIVPAGAQTYSQKLTNIYTPSEEDGIHLLEPGQSIEQTYTLPASSIPQRTTLRVAGNILMPQPFTHRGEEYFRRCETILDDNLDSVIRMKDCYSLYFQGENDEFERLVWNRILFGNLKEGKMTVCIPVVKCEELSFSDSGHFGIELGIYFRRAGRHELDVFDEPDSTIFIPVPQGSYQKKTIKQEICLPERTACILLSAGGVHFSGRCWLEAPTFLDGKKVLWHMPFHGRKVDETGWAYKDLDYFKDEINYWVSMNMSERWWPYWKISFNGETIADGKIFDRCSIISDFYVTLPESAAQGGTLKLTLVDEPHRQNFPYQLRHFDIIQEPARDFEVICTPKFVSKGSDFGVLIETNKADITISAITDEAVSPQQQSVTFSDTGLHVLKFKALSSMPQISLTVSDGTRMEKCVIDQIITKEFDGIYLSVGDDIYIDKRYEDYSRYFKWYLSARAGNWLQFRPSYQWSGVREIDVNVVRYFTELMNDLQIPYAWQVEGRTFSGLNINPTNDELKSPMFRGKQAHENDGGYYYWHQFQYQGLQSDMAAKTRPYGGIFAKKRPIFTNHGAFIHYDTRYATDMAMGAQYFVENLRYSKGVSSRHTGPSTMFRYFYQAGYEWCGAEQMYGPEDVIMSSLRGASRAYSKPVYGSLHAMQWNNGPYTLPEHPLVHYMSMAVGYMHGSSHINTEDALWTDERLNDRYTEAGRAHLESQNKILDFIQTHTRRGELLTRIGVIQGRNDSWLSFQRGQAWSQDGVKWAFGDAALSFDLLKIFYPNNDMAFCDKEHMFTNTPYGPIDIFPIEAPQDQMDSYDLIIFLGWNTYNREDFRRLSEYVHKGGTLILTSAHINANLQPDQKPEFPDDDTPLKAMLGEDYRTLTGVRHIPYGNGTVIYFACPEYPANEKIKSEYIKSIEEQASRVIAGENGEGWIDAGESTDFAVWQKDNHRTIYLLDTDWKSPAEPAECHFLFGENRYNIRIPCGILSTIHCMEGLAVSPESNTTDILDIRKTETGWTITVQTTGADSLSYYTKDGNISGKQTIQEAGIHTLTL